MMDDTSGNYDSASTYPVYEDDTSEPAYEEDYTNDVKSSTTPAQPTMGQLLLGSWQVNTINVVRNGVAYDATAEDPSLLLLIGAVYNFMADGSVTVTNDYGTNYLYYSLTETQFYIQADGYGPGVINYIDNSSLQVVLSFTNIYGTHMLQFNLSRY